MPSLISTASAAALLLSGTVYAVDGPGPGKWETATPESQGLSTQSLEQAQKWLEGNVSSRKCFLVIKNGKIVHEGYGSGYNEGSIHAGMSTTKSLCSTMFGIGVQQGWASTDFPVSSMRDARGCNKAGTLENVLSMTGESNDLPKSPRFSYEALGSCYGVTGGFITEQNPEGLSAEQFKDKYLFPSLGMEHSKWNKYFFDFRCATSAEMSCRDMARPAQLWLNNGAWKDDKGNDIQLMDRNYAIKGSTNVFPDADSSGNEPYGYGVRLRPSSPNAKPAGPDPVDPDLFFFGGVGVNCAFISRKNNAIVVTMGSDNGRSCQEDAWEQTRDAIVSRNDDELNKGSIAKSEQ